MVKKWLAWSASSGCMEAGNKVERLLQQLCQKDTLTYKNVDVRSGILLAIGVF